MCSAGTGTDSSGSTEGFSGTPLPSFIGVSFSSSASNSGKGSLGVVGSLLPLLWAASLSCASCGTPPQASSARGTGLGLAGGVRAGKGFAAGDLGLDSGFVVGLSVEQGSSLLFPLYSISFSIPGLETQRERGVSSASVSPFTTTE